MKPSTVRMAAIAFTLKVDAGQWTDAEVRHAIKALRTLLLERQQRRATEKYLRKCQS